MRVLLPTGERGKNRQSPNAAKVGKHLDGTGLAMVKRDSGQPERILYDDPPDDRLENTAPAKRHPLSKPPTLGNTVGRVGMR
jgi:hypothetical protein